MSGSTASTFGSFINSTISCLLSALPSLRSVRIRSAPVDNVRMGLMPMVSRLEASGSLPSVANLAARLLSR